MGKNKLKRFRELDTLNRIFQPEIEEVYQKDYKLKGRWRTEVFKNDRPLILELGCGKGEYTLGLARMNPEKNYIGLDIKGARIWRGVREANDEGLENVAFLRTRIDFINSLFTPGEVDEIWVSFPDPQEKRRRLKKRLTGALFLNRYREILKDEGIIHLKTDNGGLYTSTLELARYNGLVIDRYTDDLYLTNWDDETVNIQTYYETRFRAAGERIHFIQFRLPANREIRELPHDIE